MRLEEIDDGLSLLALYRQKSVLMTASAEMDS